MLKMLSIQSNSFKGSSFYFSLDFLAVFFTAGFLVETFFAGVFWVSAADFAKEPLSAGLEDLWETAFAVFAAAWFALGDAGIPETDCAFLIFKVSFPL